MAWDPRRPGLVVPATIGKVPGKRAYCRTHHLVGVLMEVDDGAEQQEVPEAQQQHIE